MDKQLDYSWLGFRFQHDPQTPIEVNITLKGCLAEMWAFCIDASTNYGTSVSTVKLGSIYKQLNKQIQDVIKSHLTEEEAAKGF